MLNTARMEKKCKNRRECGICASKWTDKPCCGRCGLAMCVACAQRCVCEFPSSRSEVLATCPRCGEEWDTRTLLARTSRAFWSGKFRKHRARQILATERGRLSLTKPAAERIRRQRHLRKCATEVRLARSLMDWEAVELLLPDLYAASRALEEVQVQLRQTAGARWASPKPCAKCGANPADLGSSSRDPLEAGPSSSSQHACARCGHAACRQCGALLTPQELREHVCSEEEVASVKAIQKDCRPCPCCSVPSWRVEGCPAMWCSHCHTFWNWDTGNVIPGTPHNPDHRAWVASAASGAEREVGDVPCGGLPDGEVLHLTILREFARAPEQTARYVAVLIDATETFHVAQRLRHRYPLTWNARTLQEQNRIDFLLSETPDEADFARALERKDRLCHYNRDVGFVLQSYVFAGADVLQRFCAQEEAAAASCAETCLELEALRKLCTGWMEEVAAVHARGTPQLLPTWRWRLPGTRG